MDRLKIFYFFIPLFEIQIKDSYMSDSCYNGKSKFIFITGGVLSGLGKGVAAASIGALLSRFRVIPIKCDGYLNVDPGTMNPIEHGEVFVLDDGGEVDMDFSHYERFLGINAKSDWNLTMGKVFSTLIEREKQGIYAGSTIQFIPHLTDVIKEHFFKISSKEKADILLIEIGGTVGDLENEFYIEAARQLSHVVGPDNCLFAHLTYIPIPTGSHEQKSKPTQMSMRDLNEKGIYPDIIIGRCGKRLTQKVKEKIALYGNIPSKNVISELDVKSVYEIPLGFQEEGILDIIFKKLKLAGANSARMSEWKRLVEVNRKNYKEPKKTLNVALCVKNTQLEDSYASIREAIIHASAHLNLACNLEMIDGSEHIENQLANIDAVIMPSVFSISVIQAVREMKIPFLGIGYEMLKKGGHDVFLKKGSLAEKIYGGASVIRERFSCRYEVDPKYVSKMEENGIVFSGHSDKENGIAQIMEIPDHPFFVGCGFHPELTSNLLKPSPLFYHLLKASEKRNSDRVKNE